MTLDKLEINLVAGAPGGVLTRKKIEELTGGLLKRQFLSNLDCEGRGIKPKMRAGKTIIYPVSAVIRFLRDYIKAA